MDNGNPSPDSNKLRTADKSLDLPNSQVQLLKALIETGIDLIVVNLTGSAMNLKWLQDTPNVKAILQGWYPGAEGGLAIARVLFGLANPSGKLPVTFYESEDQLPDFCDYSMKGRTYRYFEGTPLYPFGYGLSYTDYRYSDLSACPKADKEGFAIEVEVENIGKVDGDEIVQVYIKDVESQHAVRNYSLCAFQRVALKAGEKKMVQLEIDSKAFEVVDEEGNRFIHSKRFRLYVGGSQPDTRSIELIGRNPLEIGISLI